MKRSIGLWELLGVGVCAVGGVLLHFLYDWLGGAVWVAPFAGVNESTWEHMKLLFWPMLAFAIVESFFFRDRNDFWCVKLRGILTGIGLIPVIFYTANGVFGKTPDWINISIFFIALAIAFLHEMRLFATEEVECRRPRLAIGILIGVAALFVLFTFVTPKLGIFMDPDGTYGIIKDR